MGESSEELELDMSLGLSLTPGALVSLQVGLLLDLVGCVGTKQSDSHDKYLVDAH